MSSLSTARQQSIAQELSPRLSARRQQTQVPGEILEVRQRSRRQKVVDERQRGHETSSERGIIGRTE
jgi:hypothetical protein